MTDTPQQTQREHSGASPGTMLREAREAANLTHAAVGEALHLTAHYIRSLENDDYNKLPGLIFVKGYLKSYGRFLKLDVDALLALYEQRVQEMPAVKNQTLAGNYTRKRNDQAIGWAIAATLVILLGLGAGWWFVGREEKVTTTSTQIQLHTTQASTAATGNSDIASERDSSTREDQPAGNETTDAAATADSPTAPTQTSAPAPQPAAASSNTPAGVPVGQPATPAAPANPAGKISVTPSPSGGRQINLLGPGPDQLLLNFASNSWVEVDDETGKRLYAEMMHTSDVLLVKGRAPFQVLLGDARKVSVNFNDAPIDIRGSIRTDTTARLTLANPGNSAPSLAENPVVNVQRTAGLSH